MKKDNSQKPRNETALNKRYAKGIALTSLFFIGMWCMDIATTAMLNGLIMTNGFWNANPYIMYHVGLWVMAFSYLIAITGGKQT